MTSKLQLAPVALFAYRRPAHLRRVLEALKTNSQASQTILYVFCDGTKSEADVDDVAQVRAIVAKIQGFADVRVLARERNAGLSRSIIEGVTQVVGEHERVIVVEDDLVVAPHFLQFMNEGLATYAQDDQVVSIHGFVYPLTEELPETFFLKGADCWGWATWNRAWGEFEADGSRLLARLLQRRLSFEFDLDGRYPYTDMLRDQIAGRNDSWAIRWHASAYLGGRLTLHPGRSLVENIGHDASGTHCVETNGLSGRFNSRPVDVARIPLVESQAARDAIRRFLEPRGDVSRWDRIAKRVRKGLPWLG